MLQTACIEIECYLVHVDGGRTDEGCAEWSGRGNESKVACVCTHGWVWAQAVPPGTPAARDLAIMWASIAEVSLGQRSLGTI